MGENGAPALPVTTAVLELWRERRQEFTLRLEGRSMVPVAAPGDRITIQPLPPEQLHCGDIIALQQGETLVVHRFLMARTAKGGRRWCCQKGDNSPAWSWVPPESVLGRVTAIRGPDRSLHLLRRPWTRANPLAGRLGRVGVLLAGGGRPPGAGSLGSLSHRLNRGLAAPLIRLALRRRG